jgi:hypothetical protein
MNTLEFIDGLICLVFTLRVSTTTTEQALSAMKVVETSDEFLANNLVV